MITTSCSVELSSALSNSKQQLAQNKINLDSLKSANWPLPKDVCRKLALEGIGWMLDKGSDLVEETITKMNSINIPDWWEMESCHFNLSCAYY